MQARPFIMSDLKDIRSWLETRGLDGDLVDDLPEIGMVIPGVAAGFLRQCEGGYALMDSFVTNPIEHHKTRNDALNSIVTALLEKAKQLKLKSLLAYSTDYFTLERAKKYGFEEAPHSVMALDLKKAS